MRGKSSLLVRLLAATCVALAGCGGPALLKQAQPIEVSTALAEARDERIRASIEAVIVRNGSGAWARDAEWDEYLIRVHALSDEPIEVREVAIDALDHRIESRSVRGELVDGTREIARRYEQSGKPVSSREVNIPAIIGLGAAGASAAAVAYAGTALIATGGSTAALATAPPLLAGSAAVAMIAAPVIIAVGVAYAGASVMRLGEVSSEIKRRSTTLPVAVPRGSDASLDLFFPRAPQSGRAQIVYADRHGEHRLDIDTRQVRTDLEPPPPTLVSRIDPEFPDEARRAGIKQGYAKADLTLDREGRVRSVDVFDAMPRHYFDEEASRTLQRWTYSEGPNGRVVRVTLEFKRQVP